MNQAIDPRSILVVEDEALVRMVAVDALIDCGLRPIEAADAGEALSLLDEHPEIALIFTDINMPGEMDGLAFARCVVERRPGVGLIVTSGRNRLADSELPDHGAFLAKPYCPRQLTDLVRSKLRRMGRAE
jgi:CheY-like chemotaxis protein